MPTPPKGPHLASTPAHERLMLANLAIALFEHGAITTTEARAKRLRPLAEHMITLAKRGDLPARRQVLRLTRARGGHVADKRPLAGSKRVVHLLFTEIAPRYANRQGGYTRITKIGPRKGDNAPMAVIELCEALAEQAVAEAQGATKRAAKEAAAKATTPAKVAAEPVVESAAQVVTTEAAATGAAVEAELDEGATAVVAATESAADPASPAPGGGASRA